MRIGPHLVMIWGTWSSSWVAVQTSVFIYTCDGVLAESLELLKGSQASCPVHGEWGIALEPMQGIRASSRSEGEISWLFSRCGGNLGFPLEFLQGCSLNTRVFSATS